MTNADLQACRAQLRGGSRSFFAASLLLPPRVSRPATALYAFCRVADDLIDAGDAAPALAELHDRLDAIYAGRPWAHPADRAVSGVVARHRLPRPLLAHLLEGFAWDAEGRRYVDLPALHSYAVRVAGTVGAAMALLMGVRDAASVARACDLGIAMQLTNIARDVGEDARAGRLYLPLTWLHQAGIDPERWLASPAASPALASVLRRLLAEAERLYARADGGIAALPLDCRTGIGAARRLYAAIGDSVARNGYDSVTQRARVPAGRKLAVIGRSALAAPWPLVASPEEALPAAADLVAAVASVAATPRSQLSLEARVEWLVSLFGELDARQVGRG